MAASGINVYRERVAAAPAVTQFNEQPSIGIQTNARRRWIIQGAKRAHQFYLITRPLRANWNALNLAGGSGYFFSLKENTRQQNMMLEPRAPLCQYEHADVVWQVGGWVAGMGGSIRG